MPTKITAAISASSQEVLRENHQSVVEIEIQPLGEHGADILCFDFF
jgi:hypothetical protein